MSYREIPADKILRFPSTAGFKGWKQFFTDESTTHPAKMNLNLLRHVLEAHTDPGDVVLDPMAGTGSTVVLAAMLGRHGIAVEYEPHFCDMIRENIKLATPQNTFTKKGGMSCTQGDARELSKLLNESDAIITSPPYGKAQSGGGIAVNGYDRPKHTPTDLIGERSYMPDKFEKEDNIGVLEYGDVDAVITSPPYGNRLSDEAVQDGDPQRMSYRQAVDSIVTSPPYEKSLGHRGQDYEEVRKKLLDQGYSEEYIKASWSQPHQCQRWAEEAYGEDSDNIGNLRSESYLEAMLQCYQEFFKVLKVGGVMVLVIKNFIREKAVIRLDLDTISLCEAVGFTLNDRWYFKLPTRSFWRILYHKKYPDVPEIEYEDVLVFEKEAEK